ncbi:SubName: Full=Uncharacterized protein {ECO:0000313/EMBL:CCA68910.1} [Serendipita indica DSM 11827]|nr:SubName: Full=Uncharacterized protein {ECO:0000313/EMBL:CCA68910.1} [Serendipita indica DSM 11827]
MAIGKVDPRWLTFREDSEDIVAAFIRKWDIENDKPKPKGK